MSPRAPESLRVALSEEACLLSLGWDGWSLIELVLIGTRRDVVGSRPFKLSRTSRLGQKPSQPSLTIGFRTSQTPLKSVQ